MKNELTVSMSIVKEHGANCAIVLGVINASSEPMTNSEVANTVGISFPTAQKCLKTLADNNLIRLKLGKYVKL